MRLKTYWQYIQSLLDLDGDVWLGVFTAAIIYKILHGGLNPSDSVAYSAAIGAFAYSNINGGPKHG